MSGHSKWATIHRAKGIKDAKRGAIFTKMAKMITVAVREGGGIGDPNQNFRLRLAMDTARSVNMPKENIARAIEKGMGGGEGEQLLEVLFEGFAPGGVAILVSGLTDNKLRTGQQVREVIEKAGGTLGSSGSVAYLFTHEGQIIVDLQGKNSDDVELALIDLGIDDVEEEAGKLIVYCHKEKTFEMKDKIEAAGYVVEGAELTMRPNAYVEVSDPTIRERVEKILEDLEDLDDVQKVWTNYA